MLSYEQTKKIATECFNEVYIDKNILDAHALACASHAKTHIAVKIQKSSNFGLGCKIFYRCARGSARAPQRLFCHRISHKTLHLPNILNVIIFLQFLGVDAFEIHDCSWKKFFQNCFQIFKWKIFEKKIEFSKKSSNFK